MTRTLILIAALFASTPFAAQAEESPLATDASYVAAAQCLAYADLPQSQANAEDYTALRAAFGHYYRNASIFQRGRDAARQVRVLAGGMTASQVSQHRTDTCSRFVRSGLVQAEAAPHA